MKVLACLGVLLLIGLSASASTDKSYDREEVRRTVVRHKAEIRSCYERVLRKNPDLYGKLSLKWEILKDGDVGQVEVLEAFDPAVDQCIVGKLAKWTFAKPPKDQTARVTYPFVFTTKKKL